MKSGLGALWDLTTGYPIGLPMFNHGPDLTAAFSHDGSKFITGGGNGNAASHARVWDSATAHRSQSQFATRGRRERRCLQRRRHHGRHGELR